MAVRNFYVEADIEGRGTMLGGGPRNKEGGMTTNIYQRDDGGIVQVLKVVSREYNGKLTTEVFDKDGNKIYTYGSER